MILLKKDLTQEHISISSTLSINAKLSMLTINARPGWTYRGPIKNGHVYLDFNTWQTSKYCNLDGILSPNIWRNNYGYRNRANSVLDDNLDFISDEDVSNLENWQYCLSYPDFPSNRLKNLNYARLDIPADALFISENTEWLLENSKKNLKNAGYEILNVLNKIESRRHCISMIVEDTQYVGSGSTIPLAALDLYGKTYDIAYEVKRPSFSAFSVARNVEITDQVLGEETLKISQDCYVDKVLNDNNFHDYSYFMNQKQIDYLQRKIGSDFIYYGKYKLAEGDYHIIQDDTF